MSALLIKEAPKGLHQWLKSEARFNRRSLNQQVLVCLEWCMHTYGEARQRNPFADTKASTVDEVVAPSVMARGRALAAQLASLEPIDAESAKQMKRSARRLRQSKGREFDYGCFA